HTRALARVVSLLPGVAGARADWAAAPGESRCVGPRSGDISGSASQLRPLPGDERGPVRAVAAADPGDAPGRLAATLPRHAGTRCPPGARPRRRGRSVVRAARSRVDRAAVVPESAGGATRAGGIAG